MRKAGSRISHWTLLKSFFEITFDRTTNMQYFQQHKGTVEYLEVKRFLWLKKTLVTAFGKNLPV